MKVRHLARYLLIILITGCGFFTQRKNLSYSRNEKYSGYELKDQKIFLAPVFRENIFVSNVEDARDDFGEAKLSADELISRYYVPILVDSIKNGAKNKNVVVMSDSLITRYEDWVGLDSKEIELDVGDSRILTKFRIPTKAALEKFGFKDDILIVIEQLAFNRNSVRTGKAGQVMPITNRLTYSYEHDYMETKESASLGAKAKVIIWNYKEDEGILYGTVSDKTVFRLVMQRKHWNESAVNLSKRIVGLAKCL